MMVSLDHFAHELLKQLKSGADSGATEILISSGDFYLSVSSLSGSNQWMQNCCDAMLAEMKMGGRMVLKRANGAGMTIRYLLPRAAH